MQSNGVNINLMLSEFYTRVKNHVILTLRRRF